MLAMGESPPAQDSTDSTAHERGPAVKAGGNAVAGFVLSCPLPRSISVQSGTSGSKASCTRWTFHQLFQLQCAASFSTAKIRTSEVKKLISGLWNLCQEPGLHVASAWSQADLEVVRNHLRLPEWSRNRRVNSAGSVETADVFLRTENSKFTGAGNYAARADTFNRGEYFGAGGSGFVGNLTALRLPNWKRCRAGRSRQKPLPPENVRNSLLPHRGVLNSYVLGRSATSN